MFALRSSLPLTLVLIMSALFLIAGCGQVTATHNEGMSKNTASPLSVAVPELKDISLSGEQSVAGTIQRNSIDMVLVPIPAGKFVMGSALTDNFRQEAEVPHKVTLTRAFYMGAFAVTQEQYARVMGHNPSKRKAPLHPVEHVSWDDAVEFCRKLSELPEERAAGHRYRLPTEAEWEYACRAGTTTLYSCGNDESVLLDFAWFNNNSNRQTHPVGQKRPNSWGLYDMHGNVFQWCLDVYTEYGSEPVTDPIGTGASDVRLARGGSWFCPSAQLVRSAFRHAFGRSERSGYIGFRVVRLSAG